MPNGGVPIHMVLRPRAGSVVIYCVGGAMAVFDRAAWDSQGADAAAIFRLTEAESAALAWQLKYWLGDARLQPGYHMALGAIDADYDL